MLFQIFVYPPIRTTERVSKGSSDCSVTDTLFEECQSRVGGAIYFAGASRTLSVNRSYFLRCTATSTCNWNTRTASGGAIIAYCKYCNLEVLCFNQCKSPKNSVGSTMYFYTSSVVLCKEKYMTQVTDDDQGLFYGDVCNHEMQNVNSTKARVSLCWGVTSTVVSYCQFQDSVAKCAICISNGNRNNNTVKNCNFINLTSTSGAILPAYGHMSSVDCVFNRCKGKLWGSYEGGTITVNGERIDGEPYEFATVFYHCVNPSDRFTGIAEYGPKMLLMLFTMLCCQ